MDILEYIYSHTQARGTTGYFSCEPADSPDLAEALRRLAKRPLDSFMHQYAARLIAADPSCLETVDRKDENTREVIEALEFEAAALKGRVDSCPPPAREFLNLSPDPAPLLAPWLAENSFWSRAFYDNVHNHKPLPAHIWKRDPPHSAEAIASAASALKRQRGILREEWLKMRAGEFAPEEEIPAASVAAQALAALERANIPVGPEMRHEASLSPIALLRQWRLDCGADCAGAAHITTGVATAWGRGLTLARARASCLMEMLERASAHARIEGNPPFVSGRAKAMPLLKISKKDLEAAGARAIFPFSRRHLDMENIPLYWLAGEDARGNEVYAPCQAVFLFCNLDEPDFFDSLGSTGLASGHGATQARLAALLEVLEREAHAGAPFYEKSCFRLASRDGRIGGLLRDYALKGIQIAFQDISGEFGLPAYRCFVAGADGKIAQATGAGLCGAKAALSALTETPWPYSWASPLASSSAPVPAGLPTRYLEDLPDYSLPTAAANLALLENTLEKLGRRPVYVDITRADLVFPVARAFLPDMEHNPDFDAAMPPGPKILARAANLFSI